MSSVTMRAQMAGEGSVTAGGPVSATSSSRVDEASLTLPDSPGSAAYDLSSVARVGGTGLAVDPPAPAPIANPSVHDKYISPGQTAPSQTAADKAVMGVKDAFSPFAAVGWLASAGYSHAFNGSPNYGTNKTAFAQRFGAAAARDTTDSLLTDCVFAPLLHEDPRYYVMGPSHNFFARLIYAGTRTVITKTDGGRTTPNLAMVAGDFGGAGLANVYYPQINRNATDTLRTVGGSLGGSAVGYVVSEFYGDITGFFHIRH